MQDNTGSRHTLFQQDIPVPNLRAFEPVTITPPLRNPYKIQVTSQEQPIQKIASR